MDSEMKLMWNCGTNGDVATLVAQMKKGLDINYQNEEGRTILMRAAKRDHKDVVRILVDNGADVNKRDLNGKTALMGAAKKGNTAAIINKAIKLYVPSFILYVFTYPFFSLLISLIFSSSLLFLLFISFIFLSINSFSILYPFLILI